MKHFNNNNNNNNSNDNTYDGKRRDKTTDIRTIPNRLGNIVASNDRKKITKKLYEKGKNQNLSHKEKQKNYDHLVELVNTLNKKEKYKYHGHDDLDYHVIRDMGNLFDVDDDHDDYYKPILVKTFFKNNCKYYESRRDKNKRLSVNQYLCKIIPYLRDIINENKANGNKANEKSFNEWKIQINMHLNFVSSNDTGEIRTIFVRSNNE